MLINVKRGCKGSSSYRSTSESGRYARRYGANVGGVVSGANKEIYRTTMGGDLRATFLWFFIGLYGTFEEFFLVSGDLGGLLISGRLFGRDDLAPSNVTLLPRRLRNVKEGGFNRRGTCKDRSGSRRYGPRIFKRRRSRYSSSHCSSKGGLNGSGRRAVK